MIQDDKALLTRLQRESVEFVIIGEYREVSKHSVNCKLSYGEFRMLDIGTLIAAREAVGRERDLVAARQLRSIKEQQERRKI
jgi:hypothetical protein